MQFEEVRTVERQTMHHIQKCFDAIEHSFVQATYLRRYRFKIATHLVTTAGLVKQVSMSVAENRNLKWFTKY